MKQQKGQPVLCVPGGRICSWFEHNPRDPYHELHTPGHLHYSVRTQRWILLHEFECYSSHRQSIEDRSCAWLGDDVDISFLGQRSSISWYELFICEEVIYVLYTKTV